jgi:4-coumarate--CoA ligase (photoactive yellow protein activation family)
MMMSVRPWFQYPTLLQRFITDFISNELATVNPAASKFSSRFLEKNIALGEKGLGLDSLEIMGLSSSLARAIHLHESHLEDNFLNEALIEGWQKIVLQSLEIFSERISFKTSGSTGLKKYCTHQMKKLDEEAELLSRLLTGRQRILCAVPSHHIYGFIFSILLPRYLSQSIDIIDIRAMSPNALISVVKPKDLVLGFPEFWQYLAESNVTFPEDVIGVNSSGPSPELVGTTLLDQGLSTFFEVYGTSETAGIGWREHPSAPYTLFPFWVAQSTNDKLNRIDCNGKELSGFKLQDNLEWFSSNTFKVRGRKDDIVQIGGVNVSLNYVRDILKNHPAVKDACVRMMTPDEGNRLKAFVVLHHNNNAPELKSLNAYINDALLAHERPKSIKIGLKLPTNKIGKLSDWSISEEYSLHQD